MNPIPPSDIQNRICAGFLDCFLIPMSARMRIIGYTTSAIIGNGIPKTSVAGFDRAFVQENTALMSQKDGAMSGSAHQVSRYAL